jgi:hypothetical protein
VNSEQLEESLRTEFENYLKGVRAEMRQQAEELQNKFEAELENHRSQMAETFKAFSGRLESEAEFDEPFKSSVVEHLRLARDEGSKLAATAMAEAEELQRQTAAPADYSGLRDAIADISSQDSQSAILKSLVNQAAQYAPRGAFFIIKSEHFVGWKVFGSESATAESAVREIHFPIAQDTLLGEAVASSATKEGSFGGHGGDGTFLDPLHFGQPDRMYAIPLIARGRSVAVMYVDYGVSGTSLNVEALETLVRIAGLTVELLAASQTAKAENRQTGAADFEDTHHEHHTPVYQEPEPVQAIPQEQHVFEPSSHDLGFETAGQTDHFAGHVEPVSFAQDTEEYGAGQIPQAGDIQTTSDFSFSQEQTFESPAPVHEEPFSGYTAPIQDDLERTQPDFGETQTHESSFREPAPVFEPEPPRQDPGDSGAMVFESGGSIERASETSPFDAAAAAFEPAIATPGTGTKPEASIEVSPANTGSARLSDRPVDLPIQVADDERRLHNDARRFARLLVSEIKLYNEKKVQEGRQARDLYERLREAIDRSREMYDKRVQAPVAAKFDYFHYELVNALADGEVERLGGGYPGSRV